MTYRSLPIAAPVVRERGAVRPAGTIALRRPAAVAEDVVGSDPGAIDGLRLGPAVWLPPFVEQAVPQTAARRRTTVSSRRLRLVRCMGPQRIPLLSMVGIVVVSHSARLAEGVLELARQMAGPHVAIEAAGGLEVPGTLGTSAPLIAAAIGRAWSPEGVLVLMDLGSAVLSAECALDLLGAAQRERVLLSEAPLVEGAVIAAVAASVGGTLAEVAGQARQALAPKAAHVGKP